MGIADLVPGVSGGTIALILGVYEDLIYSLSSISFSSIKGIRKNGILSFWKEINGKFLTILFSGILTGVIMFTYIIDWLILHYSIPLWAFFIGLLLSSVKFINQKINSPDWKLIIYLILGFLLSFKISLVDSNFSTYNNEVFLFFSCLLAVSAMLLPGISGAFILIVLGAYTSVISTIKSFIDLILFQNLTEAKLVLTNTFIIVSGIVFGLLIFSKIFKWLFIKFHDQTLSFLIGLMIGGINNIWPWQNKIIIKTSELENYTTNIVLPNKYEGDPQIILSIVFFIFGILLVFVIQKIETPNVSKKN